MGAGNSKSGPFSSCMASDYPAQAAPDGAVDSGPATPRKDDPLVKAQVVVVGGAAPEKKVGTPAGQQAEVKADAMQQLLVDSASAEESPEKPEEGQLADEPSSAQWVSWTTTMDPATKHR